MNGKIRIGLLGAARITPGAIVRPSRERSDVELVAIAARDRARAQAFAAEHGIYSVESGYDALVERPDVDVVYVALPASLHREWCERALENGKHVLCEKPMTTNLVDASELVALASERGLLLGEAFHYRYHPLMVRLCEIFARGEIGAPVLIKARVLAAGFNLDQEIPAKAAVWLDARLGGGATLHNACYAVHCIRSLLGTEGKVVAANGAWFDPPGADAEVEAELAFPGGVRATVWASFVAPSSNVSVHVIASEGEVHCGNFIAPHEPGNGWIDISTATRRRRETFSTRPTYSYQLDAFVDAIREGETFVTSRADAIGNARTIEAILQAVAACAPRAM